MGKKQQALPTSDAVENMNGYDKNVPLRSLNPTKYVTKTLNQKVNNQEVAGVTDTLSSIEDII